jgi:crossover junction endodeoxyribonuclease RusA
MPPSVPVAERKPFQRVATPGTEVLRVYGARGESLKLIRFFVEGLPAPQGSKKHIGHGRMIEVSKNVGPWRQRIAIEASNAMKHSQPLFTGHTKATLDFVLPRPKNAPKDREMNAAKRPDIDKLVRACLDAITGSVIVDDSQITRLMATKRVAALGEVPGVLVTIEKDLPPIFRGFESLINLLTNITRMR